MDMTAVNKQRPADQCHTRPACSPVHLQTRPWVTTGTGRHDKKIKQHLVIPDTMQQAGHPVPEAILQFISSSSLATFSCCEGGRPHAFNAFYAFCAERLRLMFKSEDSSRHAPLLLPGTAVSGTIISCPAGLYHHTGLQFEGFIRPSGPESGLQRAYDSLYPEARAIAGSLFCIQLSRLRLTAMQQGIRHKFAWPNHT